MLTNKRILTLGIVLLLIGGSAQMLLSVPSDDTRLSEAAMRNNRGAVRTLLAQKVDVNAAQGDGNTALHWAAYHGDAEMVQMLLQAGADVKAKTRIGEMTPLLLASQIGNAR